MGGPALTAALLGIVVALSVAARAQADEQVFRYFSPSGAERTFAVPAGVTQMSVRAVAGRGNGDSAAAEVNAQIGVTPGQTLYIEVGGNANGLNGGFNGGGDGATPGQAAQGGGGGGASDLRTAPRSAGLSPDTRLIVAGGSGGRGGATANGQPDAGLKGGVAGAAGEGGAIAGAPGTQSAGGEAGEVFECIEGFGHEGTFTLATDGLIGKGGAGGSCRSKNHGAAAGGGGGGGYYGGGGGGAYFVLECSCSHPSEGGGGGGGSALVPAGGSLVLASPGTEPVIVLSFIQPENPPAVVTGSASSVHAAAATLGGTVNPEVRSTTCEFEYGTTPIYDHTVPCSAPPGSGESAVAVSAALSGLTPATGYHYRLVATNEYGTSYGSDAEFTSAAHEAPTVTGFTPMGGPASGGTTVTITGTELQFVTTVRFGSMNATEVKHLSPTSLSAVTPAEQTGFATVKVLDDLGEEAQATESFFYQSPPTVAKLSLKKGPATGGTTLVITGGELENASAVMFGSTPGTVVSSTRTTATVVTPASPVGKYAVTVVTPGGQSPATNKAVFGFEGLAVTGVSPPSGPLAGGTHVTVTGTGFSPGAGTAFDFKKTPGTAAECTSTTQCTVTAPAGAKLGAVDVIAIVGKAKSKKSAGDHFSYE